MFKKIISLIAAASCVFSISQTAFAWGRTVIDTSDAVQIYKAADQDKNNPEIERTYYADRDKNKLDGKRLYGNFSEAYAPEPKLLLADFKDGGAYFVNGFTKNSKGKRYYTQGERAYGWKKIGGYWYHFDIQSGYMDTGRTKICGAVYTFDEKGRWTKRISKSGLAPEDFSLKVTGAIQNGFDTAQKKLYYGWTESGVAETDVKIPAADRQILWCMYLESGFEWGCKETFDYDYRFDFYIRFIPDEDYLVFYSEPEVVRTLTVNAGGKTADIKYNTDTDQIAFLDEKAHRAWLLHKQYWEYYCGLEEKYPYIGEEQICYLE